MHRFILSALAALSLIACGPDTGQSRQPLKVPDVPYNPVYAGTWRGIVNTKSPDGTVKTEAAVVIEVDAYSLTVRGVCPDGNGSVRLTNGGDDLTWGRVECPSVFETCPDASFFYERGVMTLSQDQDNLTIRMDGEAQGCGASRQWVSTEYQLSYVY